MRLIWGPYLCKDGRMRCDVMYVGRNRPKTVLWARYKLEKKLGRPLRKHETVDHKDEDKTNDRINNLQILTLAENARKSANPAHMIAYMRSAEGRTAASHNTRGEKNGLAKLTDKAVVRLRKAARSGTLNRETECEKYHISDRTLRNALTGATFNHLPKPCEPFSKVGRPKRHSDKEVAKWMRAASKGLSPAKIAVKYGVHVRTVYRKLQEAV